MSPDAITEARRQYSSYSEENLSNIGVGDLRKIAARVGAEVSRNGKKIKTGHGRKDELISAIHQACEDSRKALNREVQPPTSNSPSDEYPDQVEEIQRLARKYYEGVFDGKTKDWVFVGLREYVMRITTQNVPFLPEFFTIASEFKPDIERTIIDRTGESEINFNTLSNWRSQVLKAIEKRVTDENHLFPDDILAITYRRFYDAIQASFRVNQSQKSARSTENLNYRQNNAIDIRVSSLIDWAKGRLVHLPESPAKWREVAIAIMVLTGRRQSEVMSSGIFASTDSNDSLIFSGQLKRHNSEIVEEFEIPVLGQAASAVICGIEWLEVNGKRVKPRDNSFESQQVAAKKAHDKFSRYLSEAAKDICNDFIVLDHGATWEYSDENGKLRDRRKCHLFRQIYGQVIYPVFYENSGRKLKQVLTEVMGHADRASSRKHAAESYDADVFVKDIEAIKSSSGK